MNALERYFVVRFLNVGFYKTEFSSERANVVKVKIISHFPNNLSLYFWYVAIFLTRCRPGWLSFPHLLKITRMTKTH